MGLCAAQPAPSAILIPHLALFALSMFAGISWAQCVLESPSASGESQVTGVTLGFFCLETSEKPETN